MYGQVVNGTASIAKTQTLILKSSAKSFSRFRPVSSLINKIQISSGIQSLQHPKPLTQKSTHFKKLMRNVFCTQIIVMKYGISEVSSPLSFDVGSNLKKKVSKKIWWVVPWLVSCILNPCSIALSSSLFSLCMRNQIFCTSKCT